MGFLAKNPKFQLCAESRQQLQCMSNRYLLMLDARWSGPSVLTDVVHYKSTGGLSYTLHILICRCYPGTPPSSALMLQHAWLWRSSSNSTFHHCGHCIMGWAHCHGNLWHSGAAWDEIGAVAVGTLPCHFLGITVKIPSISISDALPNRNLKTVTCPG